MKKYFIIAVAALAASAACSKVETVNTTPDKKIAFEVANYAAQTKANQSLTNSEDGIYQFHTLANQFPAIGTPRVFMDTDIFAWKATSHTDANKLTSGDSPVIEWAPELDYYWPKTGHINFYSYAGTIAPAVDNTDADKLVVLYDYTDKVITATDNILVADAALYYKRANSADNAYDVDNDGNGADVTAGVPTLFHHQLAKIIVDVEARTTEAKKSDNTTWKVEILSTHTYTPVGETDPVTIESTIVPINKGSLALSNTAVATGNATTQGWTRINEDATNISGWEPSTTATDVEKIMLAAGTEAAPASGVLTIATNSISSGTPVTILAARSVMPQLTSGVKFTLVYKVQALHDTTVYLEETRTVGIDAAKVLSNLANTVTSWGANKKITYHIIIDPVSEKVTFDPAVEDYDSIDADGTQDIININENGIVNP